MLTELKICHSLRHNEKSPTIFGNQERIGNLSSFEVAREIGVSDASIIRFCRILGYEGFKDLKNQLYSMLVENVSTGLSLSERMIQSSEKFQKSDPMIQFQTLAQQNILSTFRNNEKDLETVSELLISAKNRYVIGMRGCKGLATGFGRLLGFMLPNVKCLFDGFRTRQQKRS